MKSLSGKFTTAAAMFLAFTLPAASADAQVATKTVTMTVNLPFTIRKLDPGVLNLSSVCNVFLGATRLAQGVAPYKPISTFPRSPDGTVSGVMVQTIAVPVPADAGGKTASYTCYLGGQGNGVGAGNFSTTRTGVFRTVVSPDSVAGTFVW